MSVTRYDQLTNSQKASIAHKRSDVSLTYHFDSFLGPENHKTHFTKALGDFRRCVDQWNSGKEFIQSFIMWCNSSSRASSRTYEDGYSRFNCGFAKFIREKRNNQLSPHEIDINLMQEFIKWLKSYKTNNAALLSPNTARKYYQICKDIISTLPKKIDASQNNISITYPNNPFRRAHATTKKADLLDDIIWRRAIEACSKDILETIATVKQGWEIISASPANSLKVKPDRSRFADYSESLRATAEFFPHVVPSIEEIKHKIPKLAHAIQYRHKKGGITKPLYPGIDDILPFYLLIAFYTLANTGPLRALKLNQIRTIEVLGADRIQFTFEKNRSHSSYTRTFALDESDPLSPGELIAFLEKWTKRIRPHTGPYRDNVFIFVTEQNEVRGLISAQDAGTDSDSSLKHAFNKFLRKHDLPPITLRSIRFTGLDIITLLNDDDIRSVAAISGHQSLATIEQHYDGPGAQRRRNEDLSWVMATQERWVATDSRSDHRISSNQSDIGAATPGWICLDPFNSPIPGQRKGKPCQAFGFCPICKLSAVNPNSPYDLARIIQLAEEIEKAKYYLNARRWLTVFAPIGKVITSKWMNLFTDKDVHNQVSKLNLPPIGKLE